MGLMGMKYHRHSRRIIKTKRWRALRLQVLRRDGWQCVQCKARGRLEVDHIEPVRKRPDLAYEMGNLQTLCARCHSRKTLIDIGIHDPDDPQNKIRADWQKFVSET